MVFVGNRRVGIEIRGFLNIFAQKIPRGRTTLGNRRIITAADISFDHRALELTAVCENGPGETKIPICIRSLSIELRVVALPAVHAQSHRIAVLRLEGIDQFLRRESPRGGSRSAAFGKADREVAKFERVVIAVHTQQDDLRRSDVIAFIRRIE